MCLEVSTSRHENLLLSFSLTPQTSTGDVSYYKPLKLQHPHSTITRVISILMGIESYHLEYPWSKASVMLTKSDERISTHSFAVYSRNSAFKHYVRRFKWRNEDVSIASAIDFAATIPDECRAPSLLCRRQCFLCEEGW